MDNLLQLAMQMILCLLIAALIGALIGYLIGKMSKCDRHEENEVPLTPATKKQSLHDYENHTKEEKQERNYLASTTPPNSSAATAATRISQVQADNDVIETTHAIKKNFDTIDGEKPTRLSAPRNGIPDDLKEISGIGLKIEEALHELGIFHFDQIAKWTPENIKWIDNYLVFKGRVNREDWVGQAKLLAAGGSTEFSRRMRKNKQ